MPDKQAVSPSDTANSRSRRQFFSKGANVALGVLGGLFAFVPAVQSLAKGHSVGLDVSPNYILCSQVYYATDNACASYCGAFDSRTDQFCGCATSEACWVSSPAPN
jgi:hypothetical protein